MPVSRLNAKYLFLDDLESFKTHFKRYLVWDHRRGLGHPFCPRSQQTTQDERTQSRRDCSDEAKVGQSVHSLVFLEPGFLSW